MSRVAPRSTRTWRANKAEQVVGHLKQAGEKVKDAVRSGLPNDKK
jgi:hypothetical protein